MISESNLRLALDTRIMNAFWTSINTIEQLLHFVCHHLFRQVICVFCFWIIWSVFLLELYTGTFTLLHWMTPGTIETKHAQKTQEHCSLRTYVYSTKGTWRKKMEVMVSTCAFDRYYVRMRQLLSVHNRPMELLYLKTVLSLVSYQERKQ